MRSCWDVCHQIIRNEAKKARNAPNCGKHKTEQREERENVKRVRSLTNRTKERVCGNKMDGKRAEPPRASVSRTHSYQLIPRHQSEQPYETR